MKKIIICHFEFVTSEIEISLIILAIIFKFHISEIQNHNLGLYDLTIPNHNDFGQYDEAFHTLTNKDMDKMHEFGLVSTKFSTYE